MSRRVVVTGLGAVSPVGKTVPALWDSIRNGKCGIDLIKQFDASEYPVKIAAEVKDFKPEEHGIEPQESRRMARFTQFMVAASLEAVADAKLTPEILSGNKTGIIAGNGISGFDVLESAFGKYFKSGFKRIPPLAVPMFLSNEGAANVSIKLKMNGMSWTLATACASGTDALGLALDQIRSGRLDVCLSGGAESTITGFSVGAFAGMHALTQAFNDTPEKASRPFDKNRSGFVMGEGAGILVLEELEHARARKAPIYAEFIGFGASCDAYHITSPDPEGAGGALAITRALEDAGIAPEEVQYYNAHGTSTALNDPMESKMIKQVFGNHAYQMKVSSTKSMTGHCIGAAGALEAIIGIQAMNHSFYPPTINLENPDLEAGCDLDYVPNTGVPGEINCFASGSLGFGGHNGVLIMKKFKA
ncbi:MAG: beta-ketoacyl-ACP synthase II [Fibrobacter sp.]|jgi:3-oxoacyl-[acyl-carrier-protein] synthase II|nr:beta-ketoacyl-ACP synthase II [Fibrobacter sp.]